MYVCVGRVGGRGSLRLYVSVPVCGCRKQADMLFLKGKRGERDWLVDWLLNVPATC